MLAVSVTDQEPRPFAEILRERRQQLDLSQKAAAELIGASERSWRRWEEGRPVDEQFLGAIEETFGIAVRPAPEDDVTRGIADLERVLGNLRASLERATNVRADIILRRGGSAVLIEVKAFHEGEAGQLEREVIDLLTQAAQDAGWTVHVS